jgi:hypothetical protein
MHWRVYWLLLHALARWCCSSVSSCVGLFVVACFIVKCYACAAGSMLCTSVRACLCARACLCESCVLCALGT